MTITTTKNNIEYAALTGADTFAYDFRVDNKEDMNVAIDEIVIPENEWTITGLGDAGGGDVILNTPLVADAIVLLFREVPATQEVDYQPYDNFPADTHEFALDKLTMITQQNQDGISRSVRFPIGDNADPVLDNVADRSDKFLGFDSLGNLISRDASSPANFLELPDTPSSYVGSGKLSVSVKEDETGLEFVTAGGAVWRANTPPIDKETYPTWFNTDTGKTFTWYEDVDSGQWVQDVATSEISGDSVWRGDEPPTVPAVYKTWFNTTTGKTFTWYDDGDSAQWVQDVATSETLVPALRQNYIINSDFSVNQRAFAGGALADGNYGYDRWKAGGASDMTASNGVLTIVSGTAIQVIEDFGYEGEVTVSWDGTSTVNGANTSPYTYTKVAGNDTLTFSAGTLSNVKFETGTTPSPYDVPDLATELARCQRYYQKHNSLLVNSAFDNLTIRRMRVPRTVEMRADPTETGTQSTGTLVFGNRFDAVHINVDSANASTQAVVSDYTADAEL